MPAAPDPAPSNTVPLSAAEVAIRLDRLGPFEPNPRLAVAVSGGPDSLALALLAAPWVRDRGGRLRAFTVDHGLRPDSDVEAEQTRRRLKAHDIPCRVLTWRGPKPSSGVMAKARAARYALMGRACKGAGILHLLLAHHADDQDETRAMRAGAGSGPHGLAGMAAIRYGDHVRYLRPLLDVPKARLVARLRADGLSWIEDPANLDPRYWRGRHRRAGTTAFVRRDPGRDRKRHERALATVVLARARVHPLGVLTLPRSAADLPSDLWHDCLRRALGALGGATPLPSRAEVAGLAAALDGSDRRRTLGGCTIAREGDTIRVGREPGRVGAAPIRLDVKPVLWDGRFVVTPLASTPCRIGLARGSTPEIARRLQAVGLPPGFARTLPLIEAGGRAQLAWWPLDLGPIVAHVRFRPLRPLLQALFVDACVASGDGLLIYDEGGDGAFPTARHAFDTLSVAVQYMGRDGVV